MRRSLAATSLRRVVSDEGDARSVAAELGVCCANYARRVGDLSCAARGVIVDEYFEIGVGVCAREIAIGSEGEQLAVVGDGRLEVSVADSLRRVAGRGAGELLEPRAVEEKYFGVAVGVFSVEIFAAGEGEARAVVRDGGRGGA